MIISLVNKKGGVGKTPFSFSIAKDFQLKLQTNDSSLSTKFYKKAKAVGIPSLEEKCVYDFGGFVKDGVLNILEKSDFILIPCLPDGNSIAKTISVIEELEGTNAELILLLTGYTDNIDLQMLNSVFKDEKYKDIKKFYFKHSKIIRNSITKGMSFGEIINTSPLAKSAYNKFYTEYQALLMYMVQRFLNKERKNNE